MHPAGLVLLVVLGLVLSGCGGGRDRVVFMPGGPDDGRRPWTALPDPGPDPDFTFAIISDNTGGHRPGVLEDAVAKLNLLSPDFVINVGDLIEGHDDRAIVRRQWDGLDAILAPLRMPFVFVPGNHDMKPGDPLWRERFGQDWYSFTVHDVLFVVLNSMDGGHGGIGAGQRDWLRGILARQARARWTFVFLHVPAFVGNRHLGWSEVETMLSGRPHSVFAGNEHLYSHYQQPGGDCTVLSTTGGAIRGKDLAAGAFDHVLQVRLGRDGPSFANLALEGIHPLAIPGRSSALEPVRRDLSGGGIEVRPAALPIPPGGVLASGTVAVAVVNHTPHAVTVAIVPGTGTAARLRFSTPPPIMVAPSGATIEVPVMVEAASPLSEPGDAALPISVELSAPDGQGGIARHAIVRVLRPAACLALPVLAPGEAPVVLPWRATTADGRTALAFAVAEQPDGLLLRAQVSDPEIAVRPDAKTSTLYHDLRRCFYRSDVLELRLDARPEPLRSRGNGWDRDGHLHVAIQPPSEHGPGGDLHAPRQPAGLRTTVTATADGYAAEVLVPRAYLERMGGAAWDGVRVHAALHDLRADGSVQAATWQPDWRDEGPQGNVPGSGTFVRAR